MAEPGGIISRLRPQSYRVLHGRRIIGGAKHEPPHVLRLTNLSLMHGASLVSIEFEISKKIPPKKRVVFLFAAGG